MTDAETMATTAKASICKEGYLVPKTSSHDSTSRSQHFGQTWSSFWSLVSNNDNVAGLNFFVLKTPHHELFVVINTGRSLKRR